MFLTLCFEEAGEDFIEQGPISSGGACPIGAGGGGAETGRGADPRIKDALVL
jgi:hypothetical protein